MANLSFLKMNTFKMEISAPDGKLISEELNFTAEGKKNTTNLFSNTIHNVLKVNRSYQFVANSKSKDIGIFAELHILVFHFDQYFQSTCQSQERADS